MNKGRAHPGGAAAALLTPCGRVARRQHPARAALAASRPRCCRKAQLDPCPGENTAWFHGTPRIRYRCHQSVAMGAYPRHAMGKPPSVGLSGAFAPDVSVIDLIDARLAELQRLADAAPSDQGEQAGDSDRLRCLLATLRALRRCKIGNDGKAPQPARRPRGMPTRPRSVAGDARQATDRPNPTVPERDVASALDTCLR